MSRSEEHPVAVELMRVVSKVRLRSLKFSFLLKY